MPRISKKIGRQPPYNNKKGGEPGGSRNFLGWPLGNGARYGRALDHHLAPSERVSQRGEFSISRGGAVMAQKGGEDEAIENGS